MTKESIKATVADRIAKAGTTQGDSYILIVQDHDRHDLRDEQSYGV